VAYIAAFVVHTKGLNELNLECSSEVNGCDTIQILSLKQ